VSNRKETSYFHGLALLVDLQKLQALVSSWVKPSHTMPRIESGAVLSDMSLSLIEPAPGIRDYQQRSDSPLPSGDMSCSDTTEFAESTLICPDVVRLNNRTVGETGTDDLESGMAFDEVSRNDVLQIITQNLGSAGPKLCTTKQDDEITLRMDQSNCPEQPPVTVHQMFMESIEKYGDYMALASKHGEQWKKITFKQYYNECRDAAKGFLKLGLRRFHGVGILGFNSPEWFIADIGAILAGGLAIGIYTTNSAEACHYVASDSEADILVVENNKQLQKILQVRLPHLKAIVQYKDELKEKRPNLYTWAEFMQLGKDVPDSQLDEIIASQKPNQCCTLIYTSGTTGPPKGVMLSHDNLTWTAYSAGTMVNLRPATESQEAIVSYLPLSHIAAQMIDIWLSIKFGGATYFAQPDALKVANQLVFKKVRNALGLTRCTKCYTGAAPITKDTLEFFLSLNIPLYELYGMSESTGPHTISVPDNFRISSCGKVMPGCRTKILNPDEDGCGEICFWGRHVFMGYLHMADKTEEAVDEDGWLHSGDLGKHDENGFLYITGRIKELIITAGGENIAPIPIEDAVKQRLPIISNAMLIGDKRKFLAMLLTLKCNVNNDTGEPQDNLTEEAIQFCQKLGSKATKVSEILTSRDAEVYAAIQESINHVNEKASSNAQRIQKWLLLEKDFTIPGGELGPTMKLKRPVVSKMYSDQIDDFYKDAITPNTPDNPLTAK
ncbi:hypothetical protein scyTo_0005696, partial [Scyliorhinus torazame]|nr:hypothetical protein [Scyliorhinus torazame]